MPATTTVNFMTVVHKSSTGMLMTFPDVCKTPCPPAGPIPIPYPNIAQSADASKGTKTVKVDGSEIMVKGSTFAMSSGDEAGSVGGILSSKVKGEAEFINFSFDVKADGKNVCRLLDPMQSNKGGTANTPPAPELQAPNVALPVLEAEPDEFHVVKLFFAFKDPDVVTKSTLSPAFEAPHKISGPETRKFESEAAYSGAYHPGVKKGDYTLEFEKFDRKDRPILKKR